eukprot:gnl/MRDRNA2_/MRDRNA2_197848_c0_seq1.p1 gnl/MRDRNA2_/MRDRNA2_197848_c0~~gnl/MRDRNA2_/MRDRNA2_197848_c0_seq1.p1  ORF type:complete len:114 (-),score=12.79 gnl/MRDRNA2_/MRDRNA2_197848_c0_seq1:42-344(-)
MVAQLSGQKAPSLPAALIGPVDPWCLPSGTPGYLVSRSGAKSLLRCVFPLDRQVDSAISGCSGLRKYMLHPLALLVHSPRSEESCDTDVQTFGKRPLFCR